jgi:hypothetical protein
MKIQNIKIDKNITKIYKHGIHWIILDLKSS